jgi:PPOX class probable FMN-dependent enzyme
MDYVTTREQLRSAYRPASETALRKEMRSLDAHAKSFIARSPFLLIGSSDGAGNADVTPKGDKPGFVAILDDITLAIPDRPGNHRLDTLENIVANPAIGLLFIIPGMNETLRVNGEARVTFDAALRERLAVEGKAPQSVIVVKARAVYMHCAKAFLRSNLWVPDAWRPRSEMPTLGEMLKDQTGMAETAAHTDNRLEANYRTELW